MFATKKFANYVIFDKSEITAAVADYDATLAVVKSAAQKSTGYFTNIASK
jgi:hypothetical protein